MKEGKREIAWEKEGRWRHIWADLRNQNGGGRKELLSATGGGGVVVWAHTDWHRRARQAIRRGGGGNNASAGFTRIGRPLTAAATPK